MAAAIPSSGFSGGARLERYYYVRGLGMLYAEGRDNTNCRSSQTPANCQGTYPTLYPPAPSVLRYLLSGDMVLFDGAATTFNIVDWW